MCATDGYQRVEPWQDIDSRLHSKLWYLSSPCFCVGGGCGEVWVGKVTGIGVGFMLKGDLMPVFPLMPFMPPGGGGIENAE